MSTSNNVSELIEGVNEALKLAPAPELNYTYINSGMPNTFTILKRDKTNPYKSFPLVTLMFANELPFAGPVGIIKEVCELYARLEYQHNLEENKKIK